MTTHMEYIVELARRLVHPQDGLDQPQLKTFNQWTNFIADRECWVNAGMDEKSAEVFSKLPFGEVITNTVSDYALFKYGTLAKIIQNKLYSPQGGETYRVVMNYTSFEKLIRLIHSEIQQKEVFEHEFLSWKKTIVPNVFWIHFLISSDKLHWLQRNQVGVIVTTNGESSFFRNNEDGSFVFNRRDGFFHRLLLNGRDLQHLFNLAYQIRNTDQVDRKDDNFFEFLGGADICLDFMKLSLR